MIKSIYFLLLVLILTTSVSAYNVYDFYTEIEVYNDGVAKVTHKLNLDSRNLKAVLIPTYDPESIIVSDREGEVKFATIENTIVIQPKIGQEEYQLVIQYLTSSLTAKSEKEWLVNYIIPPYGKIRIDSIKEARLVLSLPNTATITAFSDNGIVYTEQGKLKIGWKLSLNKEENIRIETAYKNTPAIARVDYIRFSFFILIGLLALFLLCVISYKIFCKVKKRLTKGKRDILHTLDNKEQEVIRLLLSKNNQSYQSILQKDTGISKATLSRLIKRLENKNIIEVRPAGNTNLILLHEWFVKK